MNKNAKITIIIILLVGILSTGFYLTKRGISAGTKLKLTGVNFQYPKTLPEIKQLITGFFISTVKLTVSNYSNSEYTINQVGVNAFTLKDRQIATQLKPIQPLTVRPNSNTIIDLKYKFDYTAITKLIADNNLAKFGTIALKLIAFQEIGTELKLKGFIKADGITIKLNEKTKI